MGDNLGGSLGIGDAPGVGQELTCRAGIQPASAVSGSWEPDNSTNIWQRNYVSRVLCGVTNTSSGTSTTTNVSQVTSLPTRAIGRATKKTRIDYNRSHEREAKTLEHLSL